MRKNEDEVVRIGNQGVKACKLGSLTLWVWWVHSPHH